MKKESLRKQFRLMNLKAEKALKEAIRDLIKERAAANDYLIIWRDGKVRRVPARKLLKRQVRKQKKRSTRKRR